MKYKKVLVVTDNHFLFRNFKSIIHDLQLPNVDFSFCCTSSAMQLIDEGLDRINVKKDYQDLCKRFDLIFSLHCKQIFPAELVREVRCINIHPGLNPYNRGWYPQVFSLLNKKPIGATIHEMDEQIDHGAILVQREVSIDAWDTSLDVYNKVVRAELELIRKHLSSILDDGLKPFLPADEGNYNGIEDFNRLRKLPLHQSGTMSEFIDRLRALTHGNFQNAYFIDPATGKKVFVQIKLEVENE